MSLVGSLTRSMGAMSLCTSARLSSRPIAVTPSTSSFASSSRLFSSSSSSSYMLSSARPRLTKSPLLSNAHASQFRGRADLAPRRTKYRKAHKGRVPIPVGGSIKGTTLQQGAFGIRVLEPARLTAKQLSSAMTALKRKLKVIKNCQVFMRVFPDIPVCVKGNETRMGKGKGAFSYWACRAPVGRVIFEVGGDVEIREEVAKEALRLASAKLPVKSEFITLKTPPRLGSLVLESIPPANATASGGVGPNGAAVAEQMPEMTHESSKHVVNGGRSDRRI